MINLTDSAVEAINKFIASSEKAIAGLRVKVEAGGCSGFKYGLKLEGEITDEDIVADIKGLKVLLDEQSEPLLSEVTVDYIDGLEGSGFKFENPAATASCGCGKSFAC